MPISEKRLAARRANAAKSTGHKSLAIRRKAATFENLANAILIHNQYSRFVAWQLRFSPRICAPTAPKASAIAAPARLQNGKNQKKSRLERSNQLKTIDRASKSKAMRPIKTHSRPTKTALKAIKMGFRSAFSSHAAAERQLQTKTT